MIELYLSAGLLLLLAALFFLFPNWFMRSSQRQNLRDSNLDWYHMREQELSSSGEAEALLEETRLRLLEDGVDQISESRIVAASGRSWLWFFPALLGSVLLYLQLGAASDVSLARGLEQLSGTDSHDYNSLMQRIEKRARQRPDNQHYQAMLGRYYMNRADYDAASRLYQGLVKQTPNDPTALAMAAQAGYLAGGRQLDLNSQMLAEKALAVNPHQSTALGLLGMAAYEQGQYRAAIGYWRRLIAMEDPDSDSAKMIRGVIARAERALGAAPVESTGPAPGGETAAATATGLGVTVSLQLPGGAEVQPTDSVFVFARNPESGSRMPVAVKRLTVADLPVTLRLDDAASMAGQKISALSKVLVVARVSPSGQPGEEYATYQGSLGPLPPEVGSEARPIELKAKKI